MSPDGNRFNGRCQLDLSGSCVFDDGTDFWRPVSTNANQILFVTGDRQYWGVAWHADLWDIVQAREGVFAPNFRWIDAGRDGVSIGSVMGNVLSRPGILEDPWVTIEGSHCAHVSDTPPCNQMIWGEAGYNSDPQHPHSSIHPQVSLNHGGVEGWVRTYAVPEPSTTLLLMVGLSGLTYIARRRGARANRQQAVNRPGEESAGSL